MKLKSYTKTLLKILAPLLAVVGAYLLWQDFRHSTFVENEVSRYQLELDQHAVKNIYYKPQAIIDWLTVRQNPRGYFVPNPDIMFEPSQMNANTLRATRYAVATLSTLDALDKIDKSSIIDWVIGHYVPDLDRENSTLDASVYKEGPYAAFHTFDGEMVGVRPTMDALIILQTLNALDDPRIDLLRIKRFILAHQNEDGGFWDEHYPKSGVKSCMKCTSFAMRALGRIQQHLKLPFGEIFKENVSGFIKSCEDKERSGYGSMPGEPSNDSYNSFRAFISLWWLQGGNVENRKDFVEQHMDVDALLRHFQEDYYLAKQNAFARYLDSAKQSPSLKASHLITWFISYMGRDLEINKTAFVRYVLANENHPGEYGGDIYSTYSATGILKKLHVATQALAKPVRSQVLDQDESSYLAYVLIGLGLLVFALSYFYKKYELEALNKSLTIKAAHDGLTGIYNRAKLEEVLKQEVLSAKRYKKPLSVIMLDVDNFKNINDIHGHLEGDNVLIKLASTIKNHLRNVDTFARWGGEEFTILTPETDLKGAQIIADKIRRLIEKTDFEKTGSITCSFGAAQFESDETIEQFVGRADEAMYGAKAAGRNCVMAL